jgi:hypothetical protein
VTGSNQPGAPPDNTRASPTSDLEEASVGLDRERWMFARYVAHSGYGPGAIHALEADTVPLTRYHWHAWTDSRCPVPPGHGSMTLEDRDDLADLIFEATRLYPLDALCPCRHCTTPTGRACPRGQRLRRYEDARRTVIDLDDPGYFGAHDVELAASPIWLDRVADCERRLTELADATATPRADETLHAWSLFAGADVVRRIERDLRLAAIGSGDLGPDELAAPIEAALTTVTALLRTRSADLADEAVMADLGCTMLNRSAIERASDAAISAAVCALRAAAAPSDSGSAPPSAASASNAVTVEPNTRLADYQRGVRERQEYRDRQAREAEADEVRRIRANLPTPLTAAELADTTPPEWLVPGFIPLSAHVLLSAPAKTGKSATALWVAGCLALGRDPFTGAPGTRRRVMYLDFEMNKRDVRTRLDKLGFGPDEVLANTDYFLRPRLPGKLNTATGAVWMKAMLEVCPADLVVIDTAARVVEGAENDAPTWHAFHEHAQAVVRAAEVALLLIDHEGHEGGRARGTSAKADNVDVIWSLGKTGDDLRRLINKGDRTGECDDVIELRRTDDPPWGLERVAASAVPAATLAKVRDLDAAGVPVAASRRTAEEMLRAAGFTVGNTGLLGKALKYRHQLSEAASPRDEVLPTSATKAATAAQAVLDAMTSPAERPRAR